MKVCSECQRCYEDSTISCAEENHSSLTEMRRGDCEIINGYRLEFLLEASAMSEIYRARQTASNQPCLIKILSPDEKNNEQFLREANIAAAVIHPNVAEIYEAGVLESGEVFVVAEAANGQTLRELLNNVGAPPLLTAIQVARQMAEALHVVHLKGLLHRAVSPENIILNTDSENRLLARIQNFDFGGVSEKSIISSRFFSEGALNSLKYFAPEQCAGEAATTQTDVYALGIVFYEMLAGAPPFNAPKASLLIEKHKNEPPPEVKINNFDLRMLLTHTLMESLRKQPRLRHSSANVVARQLRHIEQLATHISTPPPACVVPSQPQKSAAAGASAPIQSLTLQSATTPKEIFIEDDKPVIVKADNELVNTSKVEIEPLATFEVENKSISAFEIESEIADAEAENSILELPEIATQAKLLPAPPVVENFAAEEMAPFFAEMPENKLLLAEPFAREIIQPETAADGVASLECEPIIELERTENNIPSATEIPEIQLQEEPIETQNTPQFAVEDFSSKEDFLPVDQFSSFEEVKVEPFSGFIKKPENAEKADLRNTFFSAYGGRSAEGFPLDKRFLFVGAIGLFVLFFAGYGFMSGRFNWEGLSEPVTAQTAPAEESLPQQFAPAETESPAKQPSLKNSESAQTPEENDHSQLKPLPSSERPARPREKSALSAAKTEVQNETPKNFEAGRSAEKQSRYTKDGNLRVATTILIFPDSGKIKSKVEPEKKSTAKKSTSAARESDDFTRPRVVRNPKP